MMDIGGSEEDDDEEMLIVTAVINVICRSVGVIIDDCKQCKWIGCDQFR